MNLINIIETAMPETASGYTRGDYTYIRNRIRINSNKPDIFNGFTKRISPHFTSLSAKLKGEPDFSYSLIESDSLFSAVEHYLAGRKAAIKEETLTMTYCSNQKGTLLVHRWNADECVIFRSVKTGAFLIQDTSKTNVYYFIVRDGYSVAPKWDKDGFVFFEHIIHKLTNINNSVLVHATAAAKDGKCFIFVGEKRAGKTTMLFEICKRFGYSPVSVDKVHIVPEEKGFRVYGFPSELRVLAGTLSKYTPYFDEYLPPEFINCASDKLWQGESSGKVSISIKGFEKFIGNRFVNSAILTDIVFPRVEKNAASSVDTPDRGQFFTSIEKSLFTPENPEEDWWSDAGKSHAFSMKENRDWIIPAMFEKCRVWQLEGGAEIGTSIGDLLNRTTLSLNP
jgi:hypothetical protein